MGCEVEQTESSTTVQGPPTGKLRAIQSINMELSTDGLMAGLVFAAVAKDGVSQIAGWGDWHVQERNNTVAMVINLGKWASK